MSPTTPGDWSEAAWGGYEGHFDAENGYYIIGGEAVYSSYHDQKLATAGDSTDSTSEEQDAADVAAAIQRGIDFVNSDAYVFVTANGGSMTSTPNVDPVNPSIVMPDFSDTSVVSLNADVESGGSGYGLPSLSTVGRTASGFVPGGDVLLCAIDGCSAFGTVVAVASIFPVVKIGGQLTKFGKLLFGRAANNGKTYYRSMSKAEASAVKDRLSLPNKPEVQMEFRIKNIPTMERNGTRVTPDYGGRGGGKEYMTSNPVEVEIINVQPY